MAAASWGLDFDNSMIISQGKGCPNSRNEMAVGAIQRQGIVFRGYFLENPGSFSPHVLATFKNEIEILPHALSDQLLHQRLLVHDKSCR